MFDLPKAGLMFRHPLACSLFKMQKWLQEYLKAQHAAFDSIPMESVADIVRLLRTALDEDRQVFVFGNGGSAANASHFVTDLGKGASDKLGKRFRCMSLNDNVSWMTAIGNDYAYEEIFSRQLMNYGKPGDIAMALGIQRWVAQRITYCLRQTGAALPCGKAGNTMLYQRAA